MALAPGCQTYNLPVVNVITVTTIAPLCHPVNLNKKKINKSSYKDTFSMGEVKFTDTRLDKRRLVQLGSQTTV